MTRARRLSLGIAVIAVLAVAVGLLWPSPETPVPAAASAPAPAASAAATTTAPATGPSVPVAEPVDDGPSVSIPSIGASSSLVPLGLNPDRTVAVPPVSSPEQAGWYRFGPQPGEVGPAVLLGHVNGNGRPGVFARLGELVPGDPIVVTRDGRRFTFVVQRTEQVVKAAFPTARVYGDTPGPELRLITCGGDLDRNAHRYLGQVIVFARPA